MSDKNYEPLVAALRGAENKNGLIISSAQFIEMCADTIEHLSMDKERDDKIIASLQKELVEAAKERDAYRKCFRITCAEEPLTNHAVFRMDYGDLIDHAEVDIVLAIAYGLAASIEERQGE